MWLTFLPAGEPPAWPKPLRRQPKADLYEIRPAQPYTSADLNWHDAHSRSSVEMKDPACRPAIAGDLPDLSRYDTIFVGFPIWWYQAPRIVETFVASCDFLGKTVIPFATSGGSGMGRTQEILQKACPATASWLPGRCLDSSASLDVVRKWLKEMKIIAP